MSEKKCPVSQLQERLSEMLSLGRVQHPRCRHFVEELWTLVDDIAWGRSGQDHVQALYSLVEGLNGLSGIEDTAGILSREIKTFLEENEEVFHSHVKTHNCVLGTCVLLAPAPCQTACPAGIDVPTYLTLIGEGRYAEAISVIRQDNPFPWVCGLVCTRPCEFMCVRGRMDSSISIKFLKAFAAEQAMSDNEYRNPPKAPDNGKKVAVVGAGPSGLTAAYYLALKGYRVSVFESLPFAGGMLMVGIPRYRLPREVIDREVDMIRQLGVKFYFNTALGKDITFAELQSRGFDAFFFGIGAHKSFNLGIHGEEDFTNVIPAIELLKQVALGIREKPGDNVVVIGGGNVAIDAARTSLRLGAKRVTLAYRRTREQMPADVEEVEQAEEEGVIFEFLTIPTRIEGEAEKANTLGCQRAEMIAPQEGGRKRPVPVYGSDFDMETDCVIVAIGQQVDAGVMKTGPDLQWTRRGTIVVHTANMTCDVPGIFSAGDSVLGPATVVEAIGGGKRAAEAIDRYLNGLPQPTMPPVPHRRGRLGFFTLPASTKMSLKKPVMPMLQLNRRRVTFQQVELGFSENQVREEARRCLRCDVCRRCGECVSICRDKMGINALELGYLDFDSSNPTDLRITAEKCIACGACAENCPNNAMQITDKDGYRTLSLCGTVLNRQKLILCESCDKVIGPGRYLDFVNKKSYAARKLVNHKNLCPDCARKHTARAHVDAPK